MRGAWAAGVLGFLHERGRRQYDLVYAASSGALSAAYFVAGMRKPGLAIWHELACKVVRKTNFLRRKPIIDLAYLVDHVFRKHVPLSVEALQKAPTRFYIVLTDCLTGEPVYFQPAMSASLPPSAPRPRCPWRPAGLITSMAIPTPTAAWLTPFLSAARFRTVRLTLPWCSRTITTSVSRRCRAGWGILLSRSFPRWLWPGPPGNIWFTTPLSTS